jgi:hypothetical protein
VADNKGYVEDKMGRTMVHRTEGMYRGTHTEDLEKSLDEKL